MAPHGVIEEMQAFTFYATRQRFVMHTHSPALSLAHTQTNKINDCKFIPFSVQRTKKAENIVDTIRVQFTLCNVHGYCAETMTKPIEWFRWKELNAQKKMKVKNNDKIHFLYRIDGVNTLAPFLFLAIGLLNFPNTQQNNGRALYFYFSFFTFFSFFSGPWIIEKLFIQKEKANATRSICQRVLSQLNSLSLFSSSYSSNDGLCVYSVQECAHTIQCIYVFKETLHMPLWRSHGVSSLP